MRTTAFASAIVFIVATFNSAGAEIITTDELGFEPTVKPVGRLLLASSKSFRRYGEGSFVQCMDGSLLLFCDRRRETGDLDKSAIVAIHSHDGGETWSDERTVREEDTASIIQPSLCRMANGQIGMTFSRILRADKYKAAKLFTASTDEGRTWSRPVPVSAAERSYMTGAHDRLVALSNGRLVSLVHAKTSPRRPHHLVTFVYTTDDFGATWVNRTPEGLDVDLHPHAANQEYGLWETSVVELDQGNVLLYGRTASGWIHESRSSDLGTTWSTPTKTSIPNPLAPMRLTKIPGTGILLMIRNPTVDMKSGWHGGARTALAFQTSSDGGRSWSPCQQLEFVAKEKQWFDYPFLLWAGDILHLGYRAPMEGSFECSVYYQQIRRSKLLQSAEPSGEGDSLNRAP